MAQAPQTPDEIGAIASPELILARLEQHVAAVRAAGATAATNVPAVLPAAVDDLSPKVRRSARSRPGLTIVSVYACLTACVLGCVVAVATFVADVPLFVIPACALCAASALAFRHRALLGSVAAFGVLGMVLGIAFSRSA